MLPPLTTSPTNDMDWQKLILQVGVPATLAIFLVWMLAQRVDGSLSRIENNLNAHQLDMQYTIKANEEVKSQLYKTNQILTQICANQARTEDQRNRCFQ